MAAQRVLHGQLDQVRAADHGIILRTCCRWAATLGGARNNPNIAGIKSVMSTSTWSSSASTSSRCSPSGSASRLPQYFCNHGTSFDFILVCVSTFEVITLEYGRLAHALPADVIRVLRLFRVVRILRVIKTAKQLRSIIMTVWISMPQLTNIMLLIVLVIIIFQVIFSNVLCVDTRPHLCGNYTPGNHDVAPHAGHRLANMAPASALAARICPTTEDSTSRTTAPTGATRSTATPTLQFFWTGILLLVRSSTGESFNGIMHDALLFVGVEPLDVLPECGPIVDGNSDAAGPRRTRASTCSLD